MKPWLNTSSASPRTDTTSRPSTSISRPQVASQNGQVRRCVAMRGTLLAQLDPQRARCAGESAGKVEEGGGGPVLAALLAEWPGHDRVRLARAHRAAEPRGQARQDHRRPLAEIRHGRARGAVECAPDELGPHAAVAARRLWAGRPE